MLTLYSYIEKSGSTMAYDVIDYTIHAQVSHTNENFSSLYHVFQFIIFIISWMSDEP